MFALISYLFACSVDLDNRSLPSGYFQAESIFHKKFSAPKAAKKEVDPFSSLTLETQQPETTTQQSQLISLGGIVRSTLPMSEMGVGWSISSQGSDFLVVHTESDEEDSTPNVLIYGYYDSDAKKNKTLTSRRFISLIDPAMEQSGVWEMSPFLFSILSSQSLKNPLSFDSLSSMLNSYQPSMGLGLGYQSTPETFTGWRYVGVNQYNVFLRLGRTTGKFIPVQEELKMGLSEIRMENFSLSLDALDQLSAFQKSLYKKSGKPAEMIFGSLSYNKQTIYIAVMCIQQPTCKEEQEIIDFLNEIQPIQASDVFSNALYSNPIDLASSFNIPLFQDSESAFQSAVGDIGEEIVKFKNGDKEGILSSLNPSTLLSKGEEILEDVQDTIEEKVDGLGLPTEIPGVGGAGNPAASGSGDPVPSGDPATAGDPAPSGNVPVEDSGF